MRVHLLYITWNRLDYTRLSLPRLLAEPTEEFDLTIWDNGSTDGTQEYLESVKDARIVEVKLSPKNAGQVAAVNEVWSHSKADLLGKCDNDCLVTPGWTTTLARAHQDISSLGVVGCWHFMPEDFREDIGGHKIRSVGEHRILVHPWIGGTGYLIKRADALEVRRRYPDAESTGLWISLARGGRVNGWYYPLVYQEHMDDPRSLHCLSPERPESAQRSASMAMRRHQTREEWSNWLELHAQLILQAPSDVKYYTGWRGLIRRVRKRLGAQIL